MSPGNVLKCVCVCVFCHSAAIRFCGLFVPRLINWRTETSSSKSLKTLPCGEHRQVGHCVSEAALTEVRGQPWYHACTHNSTTVSLCRSPKQTYGSPFTLFNNRR